MNRIGEVKQEVTLSPMNPWVQWKMANYLKGNDPIGGTPIFDFHDYGRKCKRKGLGFGCFVGLD